ncbi:MAG: phospholipase D-like domain-containing protein [Planctomycetes bacterium]|nr:phospholipase D-like domain-containing protein [Planctomycetota bacterium]NUQ34070.1 hypothetical protein [Planctomycetaceae bacterium]
MSRARTNRWTRFRRNRPKQFKSGASVRLLEDIDGYLPAMLEAIRSARRQVLLETYMIASDETGRQVIDALCERAKAGVNVRLVFDAVGSRMLSREDRIRLRDSGARLRMFHRLRLFQLSRFFLRTHRRILVIDDTVGYVGGYGFTDDWSDRAPRGKYHERVWELKGPVLNDLQRAFRWGCGRAMAAGVEILDPAPRHDDVAWRVMSLTHLGRDQALRRIARDLACGANARLWLATGYFVPTLTFRHALMEASRRGVDVRLYLTGEKTDHPLVRIAARRSYGALLASGVRIFESVARPMHAKCLVVDEGYANLGSANMDRWSLHFNRELNVEVSDKKTNRCLADSLLRLEAQSKEIRAADMTHRSPREKIMGLVAALFEWAL